MILRVVLVLVAPSASIARQELSELARFPEVVDLGKRNHVDYPAVAAGANRGDAKALHTLFRLTREADGAAAEVHCTVLHLVLKNLGDSRFAGALSHEPRDLRDRVLEAIEYDIDRPWKKDFPQTYSLGSHNAKLLPGGK